MKYMVSYILGKEQINKYLQDIELSDVEKSINVKTYSFNSKTELLAFEKGMQEAVGWTEVYQISNADYERDIKGIVSR